MAKLHEKVANQRNDCLNKLSKTMVKNHDIICLETLHVKGLVKKHKLARVINDASWAGFVSKLKYKADWYGKTIVQIDQWYPSSQLCSDCGHRHREANKLAVREWTCPNCGSHPDREGLRQLERAAV